MKAAIYTRVSTIEQNTKNQLLKLVEYAQRNNWDYLVFEETESTRKSRPVQYELYNRLLKKEFDVLLIYKFDRWARSSSELITHMENLLNKDIRIISYTENIDLNSGIGRAMFTIVSAFAQLERDLIRERTLAGLARAKAWGKTLGRPKGAKDKRKRKEKTPPEKAIQRIEEIKYNEKTSLFYEGK